MASSLTILCLACLLAPSFQTNYVEVYFVVDRQAIQIYEKEGNSLSTAKTLISQDIDYFLTEVNQIYKSLNKYGEYGVDVQIAKRKVDLMDWNFFGSNPFDAKKGLDTFDAFLSQEKSYSTLNYDLALLWTGFELNNETTGSTDIAGLAHVGTVCKGNLASSIVEYSGTYSTVTTTAHEIGHNLGAGHDSSVSDYVMGAKSNPNDVNRWSFSLCSASDIASRVGQLSPNCLESSSSASSVPNGDVTSGLGNPDVVCRRSEESQNSYMCRTADVYGGKVPKGDDVCQRIQCRHSDTQCNQGYTSDGLVCGNQKSCRDGKCVSDSRPEAAVSNEDCIWGDQPLVGGGYPYTCPDFLQGSNARNCEQDGFFQACCATCKSKQTGIEGCMYGDGSDQCKDYTPTSSFCAVNGEVCCQLCHGVSRKRSANDGEEVVLHPDPAKKKDKDTPGPDGDKGPAMDPNNPPVMS